MALLGEGGRLRDIGVRAWGATEGKGKGETDASESAKRSRQVTENGRFRSQREHDITPSTSNSKIK